MNRINLLPTSIVILPLLLCFMVLSEFASAEDASTPWRNARNPEAIAALSGTEDALANAGWWGFDPEDSTEAIQSAINSGARKVVIPFVGQPWIVRPIQLRSNLDLILEPGVLLLAKRGEFKGGGDSLLSIVDAENVVIRGYGATLRMWKKDYQNPPYSKAEWRMGLRILGSKNILVEGLRIESSGGDGIYISGGKNLAWSEDVTIRHVVCDDHHRQGISIISAENLLIEDCILSNTAGTSPQAGIDFEPNAPHQRLKNCIVRNCIMENNAGDQILVYLKPLDNTTEDVSIRFENCIVREGTPNMPPEESDRSYGHAGIRIGACRDQGPRGSIVFEHCTSENTGRESVQLFDVSRDSVAIRFEECTWASPWRNPAPGHKGPKAAVLIYAYRPELVMNTGGIHFEECALIDDSPERPAVVFFDPKPTNGLFEVSGNIFYQGPGTPEMVLGDKQDNVTLAVLPG